MTRRPGREMRPRNRASTDTLEVSAVNESYEQRARAARERLRDALAPISDQERAALEHLFRCVGDLPALETMAMMTERAVSEARAESFERGWREAGGRP